MDATRTPTLPAAGPLEPDRIERLYVTAMTGEEFAAQRECLDALTLIARVRVAISEDAIARGTTDRDYHTREIAHWSQKGRLALLAQRALDRAQLQADPTR
jgi:hypothetical protein